MESCFRLIEYTTIGLCFSRREATEVYLTEELRHAEPIQRVKFTKAVARHTTIRDQNPSLAHICPGEPHQRSPNASKNLRIGLRRRQSGKRCPRSSVEAGQKCVKIKGARKSNILLTGRTHFHPKAFSSNFDTFIKTQFHPMNIHPRTFSSNEFLIQ